jgi:predicted CoA-binding protein
VTSDAEHERIALLIAIHEGRSPVPLLDDRGIRDLLRSRPRIAVIGASSNPLKPVNGVMRTLLRAGYDLVPVSPRAGEVLGLSCFPTLADAVRETGPVDLVNVFRRSEACVPHAREAVEMGARCLWLQQGIANAEARRIAHEAGLAVVMDRCIAVEHARLGAGR